MNRVQNYFLNFSELVYRNVFFLLILIVVIVSGTLRVLKKELYEVLKDDENPSLQPENRLIVYLTNKFDLHHCSQLMLDELNRVVRSFLIGFKEKWKASHRSKTIFMRNNNAWLNTLVTIKNMDAPSTSGISSACTKRPGRPQKNFSLSGTKSKTRKVKSLLTERTLSELVNATSVKLRQSGKRDAASLLNQLVASPKIATKVKKSLCDKSKQHTSRFSAEEALALITTAKLTYRKY